MGKVTICVEIKILRRVRAESARRPPRHRCDACSMAWRCWFLAARSSQDGCTRRTGLFPHRPPRLPGPFQLDAAYRRDALLVGREAPCTSKRSGLVRGVAVLAPAKRLVQAHGRDGPVAPRARRAAVDGREGLDRRPRALRPAARGRARREDRDVVQHLWPLIFLASTAWGRGLCTTFVLRSYARSSVTSAGSLREGLLQGAAANSNKGAAGAAPTATRAAQFLDELGQVQGEIQPGEQSHRELASVLQAASKIR